MKGRLGSALVLLACLTAGAPAHAGELAATCAEQSAPLGAACHGVEVLTQSASGICRHAIGPQNDATCATPVNPTVTRAAVDAYQRSWVHRALRSQYRLGSKVPFLDTPWVGTHNSFNSASARPTLSQTDSNQQHSLTDQLRMDVRSLELDVHWINTVFAGGAKAPVLCHGRGANELHAGCTTEQLFSEGLAEIRRWLDRNPKQVILLYLEDHLAEPAAFDAAAADLQATLGDRIYRPAGDGCVPMQNLGATRNEVRAAGAQVIAISSCTAGTAYGKLVFEDSHRAQREGGADDFGENPDCAANQGAFQRYFEDQTGLTATVDQEYSPGLTPELTARMIRCGVDLFGFDQLLPDDGRLEALVWSWATGEPDRANGRCTLRGADGRWRAAACADQRALVHDKVCRAADGTLSVAPLCPSPLRFSAPRTGYENELVGELTAEPVFVRP